MPPDVGGTFLTRHCVAMAWPLHELIDAATCCIQHSRVAGIINLFVYDLFGTGGDEMEQRVLTRLRKKFEVGSEDWNDVTFTGQRIRWIQNPQIWPCIEVLVKKKAIEELVQYRFCVENEVF